MSIGFVLLWLVSGRFLMTCVYVLIGCLFEILIAFLIGFLLGLLFGVLFEFSFIIFCWSVDYVFVGLVVRFLVRLIFPIPSKITAASTGPYPCHDEVTSRDWYCGWPAPRSCHYPLTTIPVILRHCYLCCTRASHIPNIHTRTHRYFNWEIKKREKPSLDRANSPSPKRNCHSSSRLDFGLPCGPPLNVLLCLLLKMWRPLLEYSVPAVVTHAHNLNTRKAIALHWRQFC